VHSSKTERHSKTASIEFTTRKNPASDIIKSGKAQAMASIFEEQKKKNKQKQKVPLIRVDSIKAGSAQQRASIFEGNAPALNEESAEDEEKSFKRQTFRKIRSGNSKLMKERFENNEIIKEAPSDEDDSKKPIKIENIKKLEIGSRKSRLESDDTSSSEDERKRNQLFKTSVRQKITKGNTMSIKDQFEAKKKRKSRRRRTPSPRSSRALAP